MSGKPASFKRKEVAEGDGIFIRHYLELLTSAAWQALSIHGHRLIAYLEIEHLKHGALENGRLLATHEQLVSAGMHPRNIKPAIQEVQRLGLVAVTGGERVGPRNRPFQYRLTYLMTAEVNEFGKDHWIAPTHDWKLYRDPVASSDTNHLEGVTEGKPTLPEKQDDTNHLEGVTPRIAIQLVGVTEEKQAEGADKNGGKPPFTGPVSHLPNGWSYLDSGPSEAFENHIQNNLIHDPINFGPPKKSNFSTNGTDKLPVGINRETFGQYLRTLRLERNLSQLEAGALTEVGANGIDNIETGQWCPTPSTRTRIHRLITSWPVVTRQCLDADAAIGIAVTR